MPKLRQLKNKYGLKTFHLEVLYAIIILSSIGWFAQAYLGSTWRSEILATIAYIINFKFIQVTSRGSEKLTEKEAKGEEPEVECHKLANRYYVLKEIAFIILFIELGAYAPIAAALLIYLPYPHWRKFWNKNKES